MLCSISTWQAMQDKKQKLAGTFFNRSNSYVNKFYDYQLKSIILRTYFS